MNMIRYQTPATINPQNARLPASYEAAKQALATCEQIDECVSWADKAAALASYAKMANDDELEKRSMRIRARAIRRAGELLKQIEPGQGARDGKRGDGTDSPLTRTEAAKAAGMSERQQVTAVRVANVPAQSFEAQIESEKPPTVTKLAEQGKKPAPKPEPVVDLKGRDPKEFNRALHFIGAFESYAREVNAFDLKAILPILTSEEKEELRSLIASIDAVHDTIVTRI